MSLTCGGQGLNITCANRAISLTPWWNCAVDEQARGRIRRHGQTKETHFVRIVANDSIDDRIIALQEKKMQEIEPAMTSGKLPKSLTRDDVRFLIGGQKQD